MKRTLLLIALLITLGLALSTYLYWQKVVVPKHDQSAIETTLLWGGLSDLPDHSKILRVDKKGSPFTRQFIIEFEAESDEIIEWLHSSKRIKVNSDLKVENISNYKIYPGEAGAMGGQVDIDWAQNKVSINMSWS